jgi:hypothetical protein
MRNRSVPGFGTVAAALFTTSILLGGVRNERLSFVPWKILDHAEDAAPSLLALYWIPASPDDLKRSSLVTSQVLLGYAARCVSMQVIRADDDTRIERLGASGELPAAVLTDMHGKIVSRITTQHGDPLAADEVEKMVREAIDTREVACERMLDQASKLVHVGNPNEAEEMYRRVIEQRCAFPRLAKEAQRALKKIARR